MDINSLIQGPRPSRALRGATPGKADMVPAQIQETGQQAALSHGEFVINAETVSKLGGGNTEAGFKFLEEFVEEINEFDAETATMAAQITLETVQLVGQYAGEANDTDDEEGEPV